MSTDKKSELPEADVGDQVWIRFGDTVLPATVVEDRGKLGPRGERIVRVSVEATPSSTTTFEVLYSSLVPPPKRNAKKARTR